MDLPSLPLLAIFVTAALAVLVLWCDSPALADGDPASDVLLTQALFTPFDAGVSSTQQAKLSSLLQAAARAGYPLRVAIIASATDLGSVTALWRQPQTYADYLGQELSLAYRDTLLVIMPGGLGLYRLSGTLLGARSALAGIRLPAHGAGLGGVALAAIERLAAASGHPVSISGAAPEARPPRAGSAQSVEWLVFASGLASIAVAWAWSLKVRPIRIRRWFGHRVS